MAAPTSNDYGIIITQPGTAVSGSSVNQQVFNSKYPHMKIDTTNSAGFQTFLLQIVNDPPAPAAGSSTYTTLYKFKHGYTYVPSIETLFNVTTPPAGVSFYQQIFQEIGVLGQIDVPDYALLYACADNTYVYFNVIKSAGLGTNTVLTGTNVQITSHVFVNDIGK